MYTRSSKLINLMPVNLMKTCFFYDIKHNNIVSLGNNCIL